MADVAILLLAGVWVLVMAFAVVAYVASRIERRREAKQPPTMELLRWPDGQVVEMHRDGDGKSAEDAVEIDKREGEQ